MKTLETIDSAIVETLELAVKEINNLVEVLEGGEGLIQEWSETYSGGYLPYMIGDLADLVFVFTKVKEGSTLQSLYEDYVWEQSFEGEYNDLIWDGVTFDKVMFEHLQGLYEAYKFVTNLLSDTTAISIIFIFSLLSDYLGTEFN